MDHNNTNIERLLQMLDNPGAYSEQEIMDIINADDHTRETYRLMMMARTASRASRGDEAPIDVDRAWRTFEQRHFPARYRRPSPWVKIAAAVVGILFIAGIAVAAVQGLVMRQDRGQQPAVEQTHHEPGDTVAAVAMTEEPSLPLPVNFDNVPLEKILNEMAAYYHVDVVFKNDDVRQLRFHYEWHPDDGLVPAINGLNHFQRVNIECVDSQLIVMRS